MFQLADALRVDDTHTLREILRDLLAEKTRLTSHPQSDAVSKKLGATLILLSLISAQLQDTTGVESNLHGLQKE